MKEQLTRLGAVVLLVSSLAPRAVAVQGKSPYPIPEQVLAGAREYVISKVGETFFDSYIAWSPELSCFRPLRDQRNASRGNLPDWVRHPRYVIIYKLRIPEKPFVDETVVVNIKEDGGWFQDTAHDEGLPDCVSHPEECEFPIDREAAIEIAQAAGLRHGDGSWETDFRWYGRDYNTYAWEVRNELGEWHGELVLVDANNGAVIDMGEWSVTVWGAPPTAP